MGRRGGSLYFCFNDTLLRGWLKYITISMAVAVFPNKRKLIKYGGWIRGALTLQADLVLIWVLYPACNLSHLFLLSLNCGVGVD